MFWALTVYGQMLHQNIENSLIFLSIAVDLIYYQIEKNEGAKANEWQLVQYVNVYWHNRSKTNRRYNLLSMYCLFHFSKVSSTLRNSRKSQNSVLQSLVNKISWNISRNDILFKNMSVKILENIDSKTCTSDKVTINSLCA